MLTPLRLRMAAITAAAILAVLLVLGAGVIVVSGRLFRAEVQDRVDTAAAGTAHEYAERGLPALPDRVLYESGIFFVIWAPTGDLVAAPNGLDVTPFAPLARAAAEDGRVHVTTIRINGVDVLVDSRVARDHLGRGRGVVQTATSLQSVGAVERQLLTVVALAGGAALVVGAVAAWFVAGRAAAPIEASLRRQRQFTADASHELRTPLTIIDASLQVLRRDPGRPLADNAEVLQAAEREVARMGRLVEDMLTLARADAGALASRLEPTDVDALVGEVVADAGLRAADARHPLRAGHLAGGTVTIDPGLLRQLLLILIDNAIVHTPDGTEVVVSAARRGSELVVAVADHGPGIAAAERERVFERFRRNTAGRPGRGAGLGLPIARELAARAGGTIRLGDNRPGLRAEVTLPAGAGGAGAERRRRSWRRRLPLARPG